MLRNVGLAVALTGVRRVVEGVNTLHILLNLLDSQIAIQCRDHPDIDILLQNKDLGRHQLEVVIVDDEHLEGCRLHPC